MIAETVYNTALALMDSIGEDGQPSAAESYEGKAPLLIDLLQWELAKLEGVTVTTGVTSLADTLSISDDTARRIMPWGLAAQFALGDKDDSYGEFQNKYEREKMTIAATEADIVDEVGVLTGLSTQQTDWSEET